MTYKGQYNRGRRWSVSMSGMPDDFEFCFVDQQGNWDGMEW
jgi:hypothetical protein